MTISADPLRHLEAELRDLEERSLLRIPPEPRPRSSVPPPSAGLPPVLLCSNDYLGYGSDPWTTEDHPDAAPELTGSGASRLVAGEHAAHVDTEGELADWVGLPKALLFSSGYAANVGALACLAGRNDVIVSDALNHASIIDGCRLSGAHVRVVPHADVRAVEGALRESRSARARWVVTESYFSMDGDSPDLAALRSVCDAHDAALYVDEAHALGVFGPEGAGLCAEAGVVPNVLVGTFGKALGLQGAFVADSPVLRSYLWNRARSFVFSTGLSPALTARILTNVRRVIADDDARERLHANADRLREALRSAGVPLPKGARGPVIPWVVGAPSAALELSARLRRRGVIVQPIRPPTVPLNTARLRITATAALTRHDLQRAMEALVVVASEAVDLRP